MAKKKRDLVKTLPMRVLEEKGIAYELLQQSRKQHTAEGVAVDLGVPEAQVVKAMIVQRSESQLALMIVPGYQQLSLKKASAALQRVGAVSVLGFRRDDVPSYLDQRVLELGRAIISAGRRDLGLALSPADLVQALGDAKLGDYCQ